MSDVDTPDTNPGAWQPSPPKTSVTRDDMRINLGPEICKALHIDATRVTSIKIEISPSGVPMLELKRAIFGDDHHALREVMERWRVIPAETDESRGE